MYLWTFLMIDLTLLADDFPSSLKTTPFAEFIKQNDGATQIF